MRALARFGRETRGAAAVEFVLWLAVLVLPLMNAVDLGVYVFQKMQVQMAAQAATHAVWRDCDKAAELPAVVNCTGLASTIQTAAQSTSLGANVTVVAGSPSEGYYCVDSAGALKLVGVAGKIGTTPTKPSPFNCATQVTGSTTAPGDYVQVTVSFPYQPVFPSVSVASLLTTPITKTAWMRLN
jgi:Flp pilus assembly protein TadG